MKFMVTSVVLGLSSLSFAAQTHHYTFDTDASDSSGNGNNGTLQGAASITSASKVGPGALNVANQGGVSTPAFSRPASFTFASWININSISAAEAFLFGQVTDGPGSPNFQVRVNGGSGVLQIGQWNGLGNFSAFNSSGAGSTSGPIGGSLNTLNLIGAGWRHVAAVYNDSGDEKLYIDGVLVASGNLNNTLPGTTITSSIGALHLGGSSWLYGLNGRLDDTRMFNAALTDVQVAALVPEPASLSLLALAGAALTHRRRL